MSTDSYRSTASTMFGDDEDDHLPQDISHRILYPDFESLSVATITCHISLGAMVHRGNLYHLIPVCADRVGWATSVRFPGFPSRGEEGGSFRNCLMVDVLYRPDYKLKCKLFKPVIHCAGAKNEDDFQRVAEQLVEIVNRVERVLGLVQAHLSETAMVTGAIDNSYRACRYTKNEHLPRVPAPSSWSDAMKEIYEYMMDLSFDAETHEAFMTTLCNIPRIPTVMDKPLELGPLQIVMFNVNSNLGFGIDLYSLAQQLDGVNGFVTCYDNLLKPFATVFLPTGEVNNNKVGKVTFTIYRGGAMMQSGPSRAKSREAYHLLIDTIHSVRQRVTAMKAEVKASRGLVGQPFPKEFWEQLGARR